MQPVLSADEMRSCDETAVRDFGIPGLALMENAGKAVADRCLSLYGPLHGASVIIFCGKGNNGGDGFVAARHLANARASVTVIVFDPPAGFKGDAKKNLEIAKKVEQKGIGNFKIMRFQSSLLSSFKPDLILDAMFGTGFSGSMPKTQSTATQWMNAQSCPVVAVDIPSGINGTDGTMGNVAVKVARTITMGALKSGLLCNDGRDYSGIVEVAEIGIPTAVYQKRKHQTVLVDAGDVRALLPPRLQSANKYTVGKVFVLAGSRGFTGAAALTAAAVLRSGAGAVVLGTPDQVYPILAKKLSEAIVIPVKSTAEGSLSRDGLGTIRERMEWADVTIIGPGLSREPETQSLLQELVAAASGRLLLDADALNAIAGKNMLRQSKAAIILTPHSGEFSRLSGISSKDIDRNRIDTARNFSMREKVILVLKGAPTATAGHDGTVYLNSTGNPGMATVGSGDVLSGIIGSLWAQGMEPVSASCSGVFLHGLAGDLAARDLGQRSLVAGDLIDFLPKAFQRVGEAV